MPRAQTKTAQIPSQPDTTGANTKGERTRARLKVAARALMDRDGYDDLKITDICATAQVSSGTFYIYFPDKAAICTEVLREEMEANLRFIFGGPRRDDAFDAILEANRRYIQLFIERGGLNRAIGQTVDKLDAVREAWRSMNDRVAAQIAAGITRRLPSSEPLGRARLFVAYALQAMMDALLLDIFVHDSPSLRDAAGDPETLAQSISIIWYRTVFGTDPAPGQAPAARDLLALGLGPQVAPREG